MIIREERQGDGAIVKTNRGSWVILNADSCQGVPTQNEAICLLRTTSRKKKKK
jgi:hypothetical protein